MLTSAIVWVPPVWSVGFAFRRQVEVAAKPIGGKPRHLFQLSRLLEQVRCARHDHQPLDRRTEPGRGPVGWGSGGTLGSPSGAGRFPSASDLASVTPPARHIATGEKSPLRPMRSRPAALMNFAAIRMPAMGHKICKR